MTAVEIITGARLHFGLLCGSDGTAWNFGGVGMMLRNPAWHLIAKPCERFEVVGAPESVEERLSTLLPETCRMAGLSGLHLHIREAMPLHAGLGAGTQLTLATATAALIVAGKPRPASALELSEPLERARRSAVGSIGFDRGGFLVDEGRPIRESGSTEGSHRTVHRHTFPETWRMVLVISPAAQGLSGPDEKAVFDSELCMSSALIDSQRRLIEDEIRPALEDADFVRFRAALCEYGQAVGEFFSCQQGGVFSNPAMVELCRQPGFRDCGAVQSSWGPTVAVPMESQADAEVFCRRVAESSWGRSLVCQIATGQNQGATVRSVSPDEVVRA